MRRLLLCSLAVSVFTAGAMGISLTPIAPAGADTTSQGRSITPDGQYVVGLSGAGTGVLWDATNGTRPIVSANPATLATGVGYRTVGGNTQLVVNGTSVYSGAQVSTVWISGDGGATWGETLRNATINKSVSLGNNSLASNGVDSTFYATYTSNTSTNSVHTISGSGNPATIMTASMTGLSPTASLRSVSSGGLAVGYRKDASGVRQNWMVQDPVSAGSSSFFKGLAGDTRGEAFAISNDGAKIAGFSPVSDNRAGNWPYLYSVATDSIIELPTYADVAGSTTNGVVYGLSADGSYAVGHNFRSHEAAVLWDIQANTVLDLTDAAAAAGVLGNFVQLGRAYSVGVNGAGNPVITGIGDYDDNGTIVTRGFVLEIPEPSSMLLLVLGGVALLARRR